MPRPTTAQVAYGSLTVVLSTLVLLLATGVHSGAAVVVVAAAGLLIGLLVTSALVLQNARRAALAAYPAPVAPFPRPRVTSGAGDAGGSRLSEPSLRR